MSNASFQEYLNKLDGLIDKFGHAVQGVFGDETSLPFSYSVGRIERDAPEFLVFSLPQDAAMWLINEIVEAYPVGSTISPGQIHDLGHIKVRFDLAEGAENTHLFQAASRLERQIARKLAKRPPVITIYQIVWPDKQGKFPDEVGYDLEKFPQPLYAMINPPAHN